MLLVLGRTFKEAINNLIRNGWLSVAAVIILLMSLYVLSLLFVVTVTANNVLNDVQNRVNVSVYFKTDTSDDVISQAKTDLAGNPDVQSVEYISKDQALADFKKNNADEPVILQSLDELGDNPLLASLVVKAKDPTRYDAIVSYLSSASYKDSISRVNYGKNKEIIQNLTSIVSRVKRIGLVLVAFFAIVSILITFNTIRITIYTRKSEIEVMRLVGASDTYIRLPFIFEGAIYGAIAMVIATILTLITLKLINPYFSQVFPTENLLSVFSHNILTIIGLELVVGIFLGVLSSAIAIGRYLKI